MSTGNGNKEVSQGKFEKQEQVGFQQAEAGAHDAMIGQVIKQYKGGDNAVVADASKPVGLSKDGTFNYATPEQLKKMNIEDFQAYVDQHQVYTDAQVASHPKKLENIVASYETRLGDEANQTYERVQDFYKKAGIV